MHLQLSPTPTDLVGIWIPPDLVSWCCGVAVSDPRSQYYQPFCLSVPSYVSYTPSYIPMARPLSLYRPVYGQEHVRYHMLWLYKDTTGVRSCGVSEQVDLEVRSEAQDG